jgi:hypothetical protein
MPEYHDGSWRADEEWLVSHSGPEGDESQAYTDLEPGWRAVRSLMQLRSEALLAIMLRPSFHPVRDLDLVPVAPCPYCLDGGMRSAGSVRVRKGRVLVRACDTCGAVDVGDDLIAPGYSA